MLKSLLLTGLIFLVYSQTSIVLLTIKHILSLVLLIYTNNKSINVFIWIYQASFQMKGINVSFYMRPVKNCFITICAYVSSILLFDHWPYLSIHIIFCKTFLWTQIGWVFLFVYLRKFRSICLIFYLYFLCIFIYTAIWLSANVFLDWTYY